MKAILFSLLVVIFIQSIAFGQEIPEEFYETSQLYDNKISNDEIVISSNKSTYLPGDEGILLGLVFETGSGDRVFINIIGPNGTVVSEINVAPKNDGTFKVQQQIPERVMEHISPGERGW